MLLIADTSRYIQVCIHVNRTLLTLTYFTTMKIFQSETQILQGFVIVVVAERSEANNRVLWAQHSQLAFIYIFLYIKFARTSARHVFKMASLAVFWVPSSKSWRAQSQRSGQICHEVLSRETYYNSQVCRVCVALL